MRRRTVAALGTAAALAAGAVVLLAPDRVEEPPPPSAAALAFPGLGARLAEAARIEVSRHDGSLVVERGPGDVWGLPAKGGHPARQERVREVLVGLSELRLVEARSADPATHDRLGVDDPMRAGSTASLLRVRDASGAVLAEIVAGRRRTRTAGGVPEQVTVRRPAEAQVWLAEGRLSVDADPQLWVDRDLANLARERVLRVAVSRPGEPPLELARAGEADAPLRVVIPPEPGALDDLSVDEVARAFEFLTFLDVRPEAEATGDAVGESRFDLTDGLAIRARVSREGEAVWVRLAAEGETEESRRLVARLSGWAYQVGAWKERAFAPRLADLRAREGG